MDGDITLNQAFLDEVKAYMHEQVDKAVPIYKRSVDTHEARERFRLHGMTDKDRLFRYRRVSRVNLYSLGDFEDYYYGFMTYDTSYLKYFDLYLYDDGFVLQMPEKKAPETVPAANLSPKVFQVQRESERWGEQMGISTVADLNERITKGNIQQMMLIAEALQEQKIAKIAEQIAEKKDGEVCADRGSVLFRQDDVLQPAFDPTLGAWADAASDQSRQLLCEPCGYAAG